MKWCVWHGLLYGTVLLSSCVTQSPFQEPPRVSDRIFQKGYSFIPPLGEEWVTGASNHDQVMLSRRGDRPDETFAIQGLLVNLPPFANTEELVIFVKDNQMKGTDQERFKMITHDVSAQRRKGTGCARSYVLAEDLSPVIRSERAGHLFVETLTITCAHPRNPSIGVSVSYSHRSYAEHREARFVERASVIVDSIEFNDLLRAAHGMTTEQ